MKKKGMKMKRKVKIFSVMMLIIMTITTMIPVFVSANQGLPDPNKYNPRNSNDEVPTEFTNVIGTITSIIQVVGIIISLIMIGLLGIKYMTGTVAERVDYKKTMIPYIAGVILITCVSTIIKLINDLTTQSIGE